MNGLDPRWLWLVGGALLALAEVIAPGFFLIWLALAALLTGLAVWLLPMAGWVQVALFAEVAVVAVLIARRWLADRRGPDDADPLLNDRGARLVGQRVTVTQPIVEGRGRVRLGDGAWIATGPDAAAGTTMEVVALAGTVLCVEPLVSEAAAIVPAAPDPAR